MQNRIGDYTLVSLIGEGGMGQVWRAFKHSTDRIVALKFMRSTMAEDEAYRTKFLNEAKTAASLNHPGIVTVVDRGEMSYLGQEVPYIAMDWVDGVDLKKLVRKSRDVLKREFPVEVAAYIAGETLRVLSYAHRHNYRGRRRSIIHHDLSPGNIMVTSSGDLKILDFGLAKVDEGITKRSTPFGTLEFMAPEQLRGGARTQSDLYSVGAILHFLLAEESPLSSYTTVEDKHKGLLYGPVPPMRRAGVPKNLEALRVALLQKERAQRVQSAQDALELLGAGWQLCRDSLKRLYWELFGGDRSGMTEVHPAAIFDEDEDHAPLTQSDSPPPAALPEDFEEDEEDEDDDDRPIWWADDEPEEPSVPIVVDPRELAAQKTRDLRGTATGGTLQIDDVPTPRPRERTSQLYASGELLKPVPVDLPPGSTVPTPPRFSAFQEPAAPRWDAPREPTSDAALDEPVPPPSEISSPEALPSASRASAIVAPDEGALLGNRSEPRAEWRSPTWPARLEDSVETPPSGGTAFQVVRSYPTRSILLYAVSGFVLFAGSMLGTLWIFDVPLDDEPPSERVERAQNTALSSLEPRKLSEPADSMAAIRASAPPGSDAVDVAEKEPRAPLLVPDTAPRKADAPTPPIPSPENQAPHDNETPSSKVEPPETTPAETVRAKKPEPRVKPVQLLLTIPGGDDGTIEVGRRSYEVDGTMFASAKVRPGRRYRLKWRAKGSDVEHSGGTLEVDAVPENSFYIVRLADGSHQKEKRERK